MPLGLVSGGYLFGWLAGTRLEDWLWACTCLEAWIWADNCQEWSAASQESSFWTGAVLVWKSGCGQVPVRRSDCGLISDLVLFRKPLVHIGHYRSKFLDEIYPAPSGI
jgi:hypothetical protein